MRIDLLRVLGRIIDACHELLTPAPRVVAWDDVPINALVLATPAIPGSEIRTLLVRSSVGSGALVGVVDDTGPHCDDYYEHEPWHALRRRRGSAEVTVLARGVRPSASADDLEALAGAALAREVAP